MAPLSSTSIQVESIVFPAYIKPPGTTNTFFLGGAGVRCVEIHGNVMKVSAVGVYLDDKAIPSLAVKWKGKSVAELTVSEEFYQDIITGDFEKVTRVSPLIPVPGKQYSEKSSGICIGIWKARGIYTDADAKAVEKFLEVLKDEELPPGSIILYTTTPAGPLTLSLSKDGSVPQVAIAVIESVKFGPTMLETILGKNSVSPEAKQNLASRVADLIKQLDN